MNNLNYSIIIPHYNSSKKLERLLKSIPYYRDDIEILIVDDRSLEDEKEKLQLLKNKENIKVYSNLSKKKGAGVCRNIGLEKARGKWLIFADADDFFLENAFNIIDKYLNIEKDIVYFIPTSIYEDTQQKADRHIFYEKLIKDYLNSKQLKDEKELRFEFGVPWSKILKTDFIKKNAIKFDETIIINDRMFSLKAGHKAKSILAVQDKIYCVTRDKGSLTTLANEKIFDIKIEVLLNITKYVEDINEKKNKPYMIGYLLSSRKYGLKKFIKTLYLLKKNKCKIFPNNFIKYICSGFFIKKYLERKKDLNYKV